MGTGIFEPTPVFESSPLQQDDAHPSGAFRVFARLLVGSRWVWYHRPNECHEVRSDSKLLRLTGEEAAERRAKALAEKLRSLGIDPDQV